MAEAPQTLAATIERRTFDVLQGNNTEPQAIIIATGNVAVTAIGVGDTGLFTFTITLPRNYAYRWLDGSVLVTGADPLEIAKWANLMRYTIVENQVTTVQGQLSNTTMNVTQSSAKDADNVFSAAATNDFGAFFYPWPSDRFSGQVYDGRDNLVLLTVTWVGPNASIAALNWNGRFRFAQYSVEQFHNSRIWSPNYVLS